jgi:hypothetical protein
VEGEPRLSNFVWRVQGTGQDVVKPCLNQQLSPEDDGDRIVGLVELLLDARASRRSMSATRFGW